jgi:hypothetical protein
MLLAAGGVATGGRSCYRRRMELLPLADGVAASILRRCYHRRADVLPKKDAAATIVPWKEAALPQASGDATNGGRRRYHR